MVLKKRSAIRILSFSLAVMLALISQNLIYMNRISKLNTDIEYNYDMHLSELDGSIYNISLALRKAMYVSSATQMSVLAAELSAESTVAKNALSQLPSSETELAKVNKFLSQVGDFTVYLSKQIISGNDISAGERENLHSLATVAVDLSTSINEVRTQYNQNGAWVPELSATIGNSITNGFSDRLIELEELLSDYPTLLYDGPFSDHMLNGTARLLEGKNEVTVEDAKSTAISILGANGEDITFIGESEGKLPTYDFSGEDASVSVTKQGGYVVYMRKFRVIEEVHLSYDEAVSKAEDFIKTALGLNFSSTYYFADEGVCVVNLAYKEGTAVCYTDLIKVGVALDTGEIVLVEAAGYIANHHIRNINTPKFSSIEAGERLSSALTVLDVKRVIIPTDGNDEKHCYEFLCSGIDGEELLVYINVENLQEEKILLLLKTDGGTLTK